ncbi:MAG TPA: ClbS/DfsB family four-helix bundle protein [Methylomirabilota bacterium]|nr:ClbS/DfsB family four-helix bundle protein [Methylomirabilota bacterium]
MSATPATTATTKDELLNLAAREYKAFHETLQGLNEEHMAEVWLGTWSIKDIVAHISGWHRELGPALERIARGERPIAQGVSYDDVDAWNAKFAAARRDAEVAEVLLEFDKSHEYFMHAAAGVPADRLQPGKTAWKIIDGNSAHHYREHREQIAAWRRSTGV